MRNSVIGRGGRWFIAWETRWMEDWSCVGRQYSLTCNNQHQYPILYRRISHPEPLHLADLAPQLLREIPVRKLPRVVYQHQHRVSPGSRNSRAISLDTNCTSNGSSTFGASPCDVPPSLATMRPTFSSSSDTFPRKWRTIRSKPSARDVLSWL